MHLWNHCTLPFPLLPNYPNTSEKRPAAMDYHFPQQYGVLSKSMALSFYARNIVERLTRLWPCKVPQSPTQCFATPSTCRFHLDEIQQCMASVTYSSL